MSEPKDNKGEDQHHECCQVYANGRKSDSFLYELEEGVDDRPLRIVSAKHMIGKGVSIEDLCRLYDLKPEDLK